MRPARQGATDCLPNGLPVQGWRCFATHQDHGLTPPEPKPARPQHSDGGGEARKCHVCSSPVSDGIAYCEECGSSIDSAVGDSEKWYYESNGERRGPVSASQVVTLITSRALGAKSLVWRAGFPDWLAIERTAFARLINTPPPLVGDAVNDAAVWFLAVAPLIGTIAASAIGHASHVSVGSLWWITPALNVGLAWYDSKLLDKAGYKSDRLVWAWLFLIPVYLYKRSRLVGQNQAPLVVWIASLIVSVFIPQR